MFLWRGLMRWLGLDGGEDDMDRTMDGGQPAPAERRGKVVGLPTAKSAMRLVVARPHSFEQAKDLAENLRAFRPLIVNLSGMGPEDARRLVDFLSGAAFALGGQMRKVENAIFLFAPSNVDISGGEYLSHLETDITWERVSRRLEVGS